MAGVMYLNEADPAKRHEAEQAALKLLRGTARTHLVGGAIGYLAGVQAAKEAQDATVQACLDNCDILQAHGLMAENEPIETEKIIAGLCKALAATEKIIAGLCKALAAKEAT